MNKVLDVGSIGGGSDLLQFAVDEIADFLVSYFRVHPRKIRVTRAAEGIEIYPDLLSRLLKHQGASSVSAASSLSPSRHASADHTWCYRLYPKEGKLAHFVVNDINFDRPEPRSIGAHLHKIINI